MQPARSTLRGSLLFVPALLLLSACTANPSERRPSGLGEASPGAPGGTTDSGERTFGATPLGALVIETPPEVGSAEQPAARPSTTGRAVYVRPGSTGPDPR